AFRVHSLHRRNGEWNINAVPPEDEPDWLPARLGHAFDKLRPGNYRFAVHGNDRVARLQTRLLSRKSNRDLVNNGSHRRIADQRENVWLCGNFRGEGVLRSLAQGTD